MIISKFRTILILLSGLIYITGCGLLEKNPENMNKGEIAEKFRNLSPVEAAKWYAANRSKSRYIDKVFSDSILPFLSEFHFMDIRDTKKYMENTPVYNSFITVYNQSKSVYLYDVYEEMSDLRDSISEVFLTQICPIVEFHIDSLMTEDFNKLMKDFSGGLLNYRKLKFFLGNSDSKFVELWDKHVKTDEYCDVLNYYGSDFIDCVHNLYFEFGKSVLTRDFNITTESNVYSTKAIPITPEDSTIQKVNDYVAQERLGMTIDLFKDWIIPTMLSGGYATLYNIGNFVYDASSVLKEIRTEEPDKDEIFMYLCMDDFYEKIYTNYIGSFKETILNEINEGCNLTYNKIEELL